MTEGGLGIAPKKVADTIELLPSDAAAEMVGRTFNSSLAINSSSRKIRSTSRRFFFTAGVSLMEAVFLLSGDVMVAAMCGMVAVTFVVFAALSDRLNRTAVLAGIIIYVAQTVQLLILGWSTTMIMVAYAVVVHSAIIYRLYLSYETVSGLKTSEI
jgi:hypothetical protein